jgi:ankyrin repeat protein
MSKEMNIFEAVRTNNLNKVRELIKNGADVNAKDQWDRTLLHWSSNCGHFKIAKYLVEKGADVNARDIDGETPLHTASIFGHFEIVQYFKGAK